MAMSFEGISLEKHIQIKWWLFKSSIWLINKEDFELKLLFKTKEW